MGMGELALRLLAALLFAGAVGVQRQLTGKIAGMRTHILVGVGAALFTLVSGYAFGATAANADRVAAQVVSGIGFIGGGVILRERGSIKGVTTAAGLWAVAALGMAAGAGLYATGAAGTGVVLLTLVVLRRAERWLPQPRHEAWVVTVTLPGPVPLGALRAALAPDCRALALVGVRQDVDSALTFAVELAPAREIPAINERLVAAGARAITWQAAGNAEEGH